jgi:hypothetical protein
VGDRDVDFLAIDDGLPANSHLHLHRGRDVRGFRTIISSRALDPADHRFDGASIVVEFDPRHPRVEVITAARSLTQRSARVGFVAWMADACRFGPWPWDDAYGGLGRLGRAVVLGGTPRSTVPSAWPPPASDLLVISGHGSSLDVAIDDDTILCARAGLERGVDPGLRFYSCLHNGACHRQRHFSRSPTSTEGLVSIGSVDTKVLVLLNCYAADFGLGWHEWRAGLLAQALSSGVHAVIAADALVTADAAASGDRVRSLVGDGVRLGDVVRHENVSRRREEHWRTTIEGDGALVLFGDPDLAFEPTETKRVRVRAVHPDAAVGTAAAASPAGPPGLISDCLEGLTHWTTLLASTSIDGQPRLPTDVWRSIVDAIGTLRLAAGIARREHGRHPLELEQQILPTVTSLHTRLGAAAAELVLSSSGLALSAWSAYFPVRGTVQSARPCVCGAPRQRIAYELDPGGVTRYRYRCDRCGAAGEDDGKDAVLVTGLRADESSCEVHASLDVTGVDQWMTAVWATLVIEDPLGAASVTGEPWTGSLAPGERCGATMRLAEPVNLGPGTYPVTLLGVRNCSPFLYTAFLPLAGR